MIQISSDAAFCAVIAGAFLIYCEMCAPGRVVPGALGAVGVLGGGWLLSQRHFSIPGLICVGAGLLFLTAAILLRSYRVWATLALICLCGGSSLLLAGADAISPVVAILLPALWAAVTIALGRLGLQAHANKRTII